MVAFLSRRLIRHLFADLPPFLKSSFTTFVCLDALALIASVACVPILFKRLRHFRKYYDTQEYLLGIENNEDLTCPHECQSSCEFLVRCVGTGR